MKILFLFLSWTSVFAQETAPIALYPGMSQSIPTPPGRKITFDKKGIVSAKDQGHRLELIGKKTGVAHVIVGPINYEVHVLRESVFKTYQKLLKWKEGKLGPQIKIDGGKIFVNGQIHTFYDWENLSKWMTHEDEFFLQARIDKETQKQIQNRLTQLSNENNIPYGVFSLQPDWNLSFNSKENSNASMYKKVFAPLGVKIHQSSHALAAVPMIEVNILAAEIRRGELSKFGVNWPASAQIQLVPSVGLSPNSLFVSVDAFEQQGVGKVLASPTLLAQSGEEATFHSGGEFPIKTSNQFNAAVNWKKYGILLKIKPHADFTGKMSISIECEVSMIDHASTVDGVPGLLINRMSSHFNLSETKTIALSGLIKEEWGKSSQGLPGFKNIPIFSQLFSSTQYMNNQSELLFFVTPRIVK